MKNEKTFKPAIMISAILITAAVVIIASIRKKKA